ncbi:glycosyltransferase family 2 protein [Hirschia baltica]|uniref:Glycosyl transferase family 2 n=1 Tax=Hirschia baltica (strain ATCC 49814 / DSM 5838 / IFAM 1418) TaxID=582402 RepID=C6XLZ7_HIRBI|nr:glycosyltransferase [Hirschia baltica]ACT59829.1 glycosyl transferase family 2 [Hirschia baltica ATCC 49814]
MERTSVIIPTYNRADFLVEALESVLNQTLPPAEILVMDDGSPDDTAARMQAYGDRIRYIQKDNSGKADTLNQALKLTQNPLIWIMDDDDIAHPDALENLTKLLDGQPEIGIAYGKYNRFSINEQNGERVFQDVGHWTDCEANIFFTTTLQDFFVHHPGMLVRKSAYDAAGPFSLDYPRLEDYEMLVRLAQVTRTANTNSSIFLQRQHEGDRVGGLVAAERTQRWIDEEKQFFTKLYNELDLNTYLNVFKKYDLSPLEKRQALIQRAVIMARKKLWHFALSDLEQASSIEAESNPSLSSGEAAILRFILFSKYGSTELIEDNYIVEDLKKIAKISSIGSLITKSIARSQIWFIRNSAKTYQFAALRKHAAIMVSLYLAG